MAAQASLEPAFVFSQHCQATTSSFVLQTNNEATEHCFSRRTPLGDKPFSLVCCGAPKLQNIDVRGRIPRATCSKMSLAQNIRRQRSTPYLLFHGRLPCSFPRQILHFSHTRSHHYPPLPYPHHYTHHQSLNRMMERMKYFHP